MEQASTILSFDTPGRGFTDITSALAGRMMLGTWQGIYLAEHRRMPHRRQIAVHLIGE